MFLFCIGNLASPTDLVEQESTVLGFIAYYYHQLDPLHNAKRYTDAHLFTHKEQLSSNHLPPLTPVRALFNPSEGVFERVTSHARGV